MNARLRNASISDCYLLFKWVNDKEVRSNSFNINNIGYNEHIQWLSIKLKSDSSYIFILEEGNKVVGQIRADIEEDRALIDYSIDKEFRGKGYGHKILFMLEEKIIKDRIAIKYLEGKVKLDNISSQKCFEGNNYNKYEEKTHIRYEKCIRKLV